MLLIFDYNTDVNSVERITILTTHAHARENGDNNMEMTEASVNVVCTVYKVSKYTCM